MYLALIVLPILGSIFAGFFGRKVGVSGSQLITCLCVITTTILAIICFIEVGLNNILVKVYLFRWIDAELLNVAWCFNFDSLTVSMLIPVLIISSLVHVYSIGYMSHDPHNQRFFSYLSLFTFMMIILVTGDNYLVMFVGWEGVGVCSYLLVSFWFTRIAANQSSLAAFLTNRVGDCVLTIGMFAILWSFGNVDYTTVFSLTPYYSESVVVFVGICLLIGAMAKSSQVGLHVWLPMAMEGPTPVSALIHAATMVTAGVYLLMRSSPLIEFSTTVLILCLWVGAITTVFSSLIGLFQQDIKKVIAYSTMSQLGMMVIAIGLSCYNVALFHLINHAFYKGLLFLGAGSVIHSVADNQDFRKYGGLISYLPLTYSVMLIASLSLVAFPFMAGFYSKDFILESAYGQYNISSITVYFIAAIGAMFTTLYSVKVLYLTFLSNPNGPLINYQYESFKHKNHSVAHEGDIFMSIPLIILAVFSIFYGYITKDIYIGLGSDFFSDNSLFIHPTHEIMIDTEFAVPTVYKLLPLFFTVTLTIVSIVLTEFYPKYVISFKFSKLGYNIFSFLNQRFLVELYYNNYISGVILDLGSHTTKIMDKGVVETFGPSGLEKKLTQISKSIDSLSTGIVTSYALYILIGLIFYISVVYLSKTNADYMLLIIIIYSLINIDFKNSHLSNDKLNKSSNFSLTLVIILYVCFAICTLLFSYGVFLIKVLTPYKFYIIGLIIFLYIFGIKNIFKFIYAQAPYLAVSTFLLCTFTYTDYPTASYLFFRFISVFFIGILRIIMNYDTIRNSYDLLKLFLGFAPSLSISVIIRLFFSDIYLCEGVNLQKNILPKDTTNIDLDSTQEQGTELIQDDVPVYRTRANIFAPASEQVNRAGLGYILNDNSDAQTPITGTQSSQHPLTRLGLAGNISMGIPRNIIPVQPLTIINTNPDSGDHILRGSLVGPNISNSHASVEKDLLNKANDISLLRAHRDALVTNDNIMLLDNIIKNNNTGTSSLIQADNPYVIQSSTNIGSTLVSAGPNVELAQQSDINTLHSESLEGNIGTATGDLVESTVGIATQGSALETVGVFDISAYEGFVLDIKHSNYVQLVNKFLPLNSHPVKLGLHNYNTNPTSYPISVLTNVRLTLIERANESIIDLETGRVGNTTGLVQNGGLSLNIADGFNRPWAVWSNLKTNNDIVTQDLWPNCPKNVAFGDWVRRDPVPNSSSLISYLPTKDVSVSKFDPLTNKISILLDAPIGNVLHYGAVNAVLNGFTSNLADLDTRLDYVKNSIFCVQKLINTNLDDPNKFNFTHTLIGVLKSANYQVYIDKDRIIQDIRKSDAVLDSISGFNRKIMSDTNPISLGLFVWNVQALGRMKLFLYYYYSYLSKNDLYQVER